MGTNTRKLADLLANIDDNSKVTSAGLLDATITATDLAPNSVDSSELVAGAVTNAKLNLDYSNSNYRAPTVDANFSATTQSLRSASATVNYGVNDILVFLNGVCLTPTTDYTISGTTLTLVGGAPPASSNLVVRYLPLTG